MITARGWVPPTQSCSSRARACAREEEVGVGTRGGQPGPAPTDTLEGVGLLLTKDTPEPTL